MSVLFTEQSAGMLPGFSDPVMDAQATFRTILNAMSYPGTWQPLDLLKQIPDPLTPASAAILLTLLDPDTRFFTDVSPAPFAEWLSFHTGCIHSQDPAAADFILLTRPHRAFPWQAFPLGTDDAPHLSATLVLQIRSGEPSHTVSLRGPGIKDRELVTVSGLYEGFFTDRAAVTALFPRGIDCLITDQSKILGLPRTTVTEACACM